MASFVNLVFRLLHIRPSREADVEAVLELSLMSHLSASSVPNRMKFIPFSIYISIKIFMAICSFCIKFYRKVSTGRSHIY